MKKMQHYVYPFGWSFIITNLLSALLVPAKENNPSLLNLMQDLSSSHWITHGILVLLCFFILGFILAPILKKGVDSNVLSVMIALSSVIGGIIIMGFYVFSLATN